MLPDRMNPPASPAGVQVLSRVFLAQYQQRIVMLLGGEPGVADFDALNEMLSKVAEAGAPSGKKDPVEVAAVYGLGLAQRPFRAGNMQLAAVAITIVLRINGWLFSPPEVLYRELIQGLARQEVSAEELVAFLRCYISPDPERSDAESLAGGADSVELDR